MEKFERAILIVRDPDNFDPYALRAAGSCLAAIVTDQHRILADYDKTLKDIAESEKKLAELCYEVFGVGGLEGMTFKQILHAIEGEKATSKRAST